MTAQNIAIKECVFRRTPTGDLVMVVHLPPGWKATDRRAAIVFFFGGGWRQKNLAQFTDQANALARLGLVAARADYRSTTEDGASIEDLIGDAKSAVRYLRAHAADLGVDPHRIAGAGGSSGGHLAACAAVIDGFEAEGEDLSVPSRPDLLVLFNPVLNLVRPAADAAPDEAKRPISPCCHVTRQTPATILFFGTEDRLRKTGDDFLAAARKAGADAEMITYDGQGHGFFNREPYKSETLAEAVRFLEAHGWLQRQAGGAGHGLSAGGPGPTS